MSAREKAARYFEYSVNCTFYRKPQEMMDTFDRAGFRSAFESHKHDRIVRSGLNKIMPEALLNWLLINFFGCVLVVRK
jgi:hypothetical protein